MALLPANASQITDQNKLKGCSNATFLANLKKSVFCSVIENFTRKRTKKYLPSFTVSMNSTVMFRADAVFISLMLKLGMARLYLNCIKL